ncbi:Cytochrome P450 81E8 [Hibiscus syriacus]|uniref:Cytochrome P450 81E8 n=1 Tax=Hibiscus syriacus TaxID=106335 RepID=A0A6A2YHG2_HIBSY|nr:Cytochrome P450 81E8 [Hibiscus syriacus]
MEGITIIYSSLSFFFLLICLNLLFQFKKHPKNLPPSPPSLPILGHVHLLKPPLHRFYHRLSQTYGPVFSLRLGSRFVVVVSSSTVAEECFTKNDVVLANRPNLIMGNHFGYNYTTIATSSYGDHWRNLRRICATEIFSLSRLNAFASVRKDEVRRLLVKLSRDSRQGFAKVELKSMLTDLTFNNIVRMVAGKRYYGDEVTDEDEARGFREVIAETFRKWRSGNSCRFLPCGELAWRVRKEGEKSCAEVGWIPEKVDRGAPMARIGTDTSAVTIEWAMSNLLNHPEVLRRAKAEIDSEIGEENLIDESDLPKLKYLQSIVFETLRLYPAAPLLLPHVPSSDCTISGYVIPRGTIVLVNAWSIHRDPKSWEDPTSFKPERFENDEKLGGNGDLGSHKLMSFGLGRRACPGVGLAQRVVGLTLGALIQCFEWKRVDDKEIDMVEFPTQGNPMQVLSKKLERLRVCLKALNQLHFGDISMKIKLKRDELERQQVLALGDGVGIEREIVLQQELRDLKEAEAFFYKQKAKVQWLQEGDQASKFFHSIVAAKTKKGTIRVLKDDHGNRLESFDSMASEMIAFFTKQIGTADPNVNGCDKRLLRELVCYTLLLDVAIVLVKEIFTDEIKVVVFGQGNDKAPGSDGYTSCFFKKARSVVSDDFVAAVRHFFIDSSLLPAFNAIAVALVPKISNPSMVKDFRPISCCSIVYKIITKILVEGLISAYFTVARYSISFNGSLVGLFKGTRGNRQRDLLSPFLFVLLMNVLSCLLNMDATKGCLVESIIGVNCVLNYFYWMSSLKLNAVNCELFMAGVISSQAEAMQRVSRVANYWCRQLILPQATIKLVEQLCSRFFWKGSDTTVVGARVS